MASGKTWDMIALTRSFRYYPEPEWKQKPRDRSLRGKARVRARKAANRG